MPSSMRDPWFVTGVLANLALGVVLAGLVLAPMYMALRWWIARWDAPATRKASVRGTVLKQRPCASAHPSQENRRLRSGAALDASDFRDD